MAAILNFQNGGHEVCVKALFHVLLLYIHVLDVYAYDFDVKDTFASNLKTSKNKSTTLTTFWPPSWILKMAASKSRNIRNLGYTHDSSAF